MNCIKITFYFLINYRYWIEIKKIPKDKWEEMSYQLNIWNWPKELKHCQPDWWLNDEVKWTRESRDKKLNILWPLKKRMWRILNNKIL